MLKKAFTLTEMLIVIAIMSVLMAIMVPVISKARQDCRQIYCLNNLRQMVIASQAYCQTHDDYYPIAHYSRSTEEASYEYCWDFTTIANGDGNEVEVVPGLLWQGQTIEKIQQCPSFKGNSNTLADPYTGYNYNTSYIGHGEGESIETPAKASRVRRSYECALFGDGQWSGGANKFMRAPWKWEGDTDYSLKSGGTQGYRHNGKTNVAWCDGHASTEKECYIETVPPEKQKIERYNKSAREKTGFLSPDNSAYDLK